MTLTVKPGTLDVLDKIVGVAGISRGRVIDRIVEKLTRTRNPALLLLQDLDQR